MKGIRIRPEKKGLKTSLFDLEADIMEIVWSSQWKSFAVSDVVAQMEKERQVAYTTIMTTVSRLFDKGLLSRTREGRRYVYSPRMTHEEFLRQMTRDVLSSLPPIGHNEAMALLVEQVSEADQDALDELESLIQAKRRKRKT